MSQVTFEGLVGLKDLQLLDVAHPIDDHHLQSLSLLTQLTSLGVTAIGNPGVTNLPLHSLTGLTKLRKLKWHAGV